MPRSRRWLGLASLTLLLLPISAGCAQVRGQISADTAQGPVSVTGSLFDAEGRILTLADGLEEVGRLSTSNRYIAAFYGLAPPTWTWDVSPEINDALQRYGGEGVINLEATVEEPNGGEIFLAFYTQTTPLVPIWIRVRLTGKVVRRRHRPEEERAREERAREERAREERRAQGEPAGE